LQLKLILTGYGTVGKSFVKVIVEEKNNLNEKYNIEPVIIAICEVGGSLFDPNGLPIEEIVKANDIKTLPYWKEGLLAEKVIRENEAGILVEMTWTNPETGKPAIDYVRAAFETNKHVVSSNKGPFFLFYDELKKAADEKGLLIGIEATVGSAIPCINAKRSLAGNPIKRIEAILNGTSNYILTRMTSEGLDLNSALLEAQSMGYAEADPKLDIEGYDAAGKLVILTNELMGTHYTIKDVDIRGITKINPQAIALASKREYIIKHVAEYDGKSLRVGLKLIPESSPLAINGTLNCVLLETELAGEIIFIGRGAGGKEAASAVLADIINIFDLKFKC
jgi:homoserine dehydrogenase